MTTNSVSLERAKAKRSSWTFEMYHGQTTTSHIDSDDLPSGFLRVLNSSVHGTTGLYSVGWPLVCIESSHLALSPTVFTRAIHITNFNAPVGIVLPYSPLLGNLSINSFFYGLLAYGLWLIPGPFKRRRRKRKGLCPKCKYNLRGDHDAGCPECGWGRQLDAARVSET